MNFLPQRWSRFVSMSAVADRFSNALSDRYKVDHEIGAERFLQEIKAAANLQHPLILPLFDSGAVDSFLYYVAVRARRDIAGQAQARDTAFYRGKRFYRKSRCKCPRSGWPGRTYALACMLYEMLVGEPPDTSPNAQGSWLSVSPIRCPRQNGYANQYQTRSTRRSASPLLLAHA